MELFLINYINENKIKKINSKHKLGSGNNKAGIDKGQRRKNIIEAILFVFFMAGGGLMIWEIEIYRDTFIPYKIPATIFILSGLIATAFLRNWLSVYLVSPWLFVHIFYCVMTVGSVCVFAFMFINYRFPATGVETAQVQIIKADHLARGRKFVLIEYKGDEKEVFFEASMEVKGCKYANLAIQQGAFGFDIITGKQLVK